MPHCHFASHLRRRNFRLFATAAIFLVAATLSPPARAADSMYIDQIPQGQMVILPPVNSALLGSHLTGAPSVAPSIAPGPRFSAPRRGNSATTLEIGNNNSVLQVQTGSNDRSAVGILGNHNSVGIVQAGNDLVSDLLLIGTQGMSVGVIQPNHSAPVRMAVIRVPAGTVIIPH